MGVPRARFEEVLRRHQVPFEEKKTVLKCDLKNGRYLYVSSRPNVTRVDFQFSPPPTMPAVKRLSRLERPSGKIECELDFKNPDEVVLSAFEMMVVHGKKLPRP